MVTSSRLPAIDPAPAESGPLIPADAGKSPRSDSHFATERQGASATTLPGEKRFPSISNARSHDCTRHFRRVDRKIALLRRCGLFAEKTPGIEITRACNAEELRAAYELVHEIFVERGYCKPEEYGMRLRVFEGLEMATFIAKSGGRIVGVLSVVGHSADCGLPSDRAFKAELDALRSSLPDARFCEWSNQVVASEFRKTNVPTELMRCAAAHVIKAGYSHSIISVSAVHTPFYELLGFKQIGPKRSYSADLEDPVIPLCLSSRLYLAPAGQEDELAGFVRRFMAAENPHLPEIDAWNSAARRLFTDLAALQRLFGQNSRFLRCCALDAQTALIHQWGPHVFSRVVGNTATSCILAWLSTGFEMAKTAAKSLGSRLAGHVQRLRGNTALRFSSH